MQAERLVQLPPLYCLRDRFVDAESLVLPLTLARLRDGVNSLIPAETARDALHCLRT